ncbi:MAG: DNA-directed RNA polymerase subunit omega [Flammeovirgaceae bacterium]|nr:DNA-directed RNA polymerase subunit omega [Flammeovirgaceae bacterium]|tara:strand:+ start:6904 stop:7236 length:333 start_codon:yes stop_codon:yes gene_type:complete
MKIKSSLNTRDYKELSSKTGNIYKSVNIIGKRAKQISAVQKEELNSKLAEFASDVDNLEEIFENREQIEISRYYERLPKPTTIATEELLNDELIFRNSEEKEEDLSNSNL